MESTLSTKQHLHGHALKKKLLKGMDGLLPMPQVVLKAQNLLIDPNSKFDDLSDIIETDQDSTMPKSPLNCAKNGNFPKQLPAPSDIIIT
jgi:hypothetical protein